jgi:hypothetical protein
MNAQEFIQHQCKLLADSFQVDSIRYKYDALSETHFIQVLPEDLYNNDLAYEAFEESLIETFYEHFPDEGICVFSENSIESLQNMPVLFERIPPVQAIPAVFDQSFIVSSRVTKSETNLFFEINTPITSHSIPNIFEKSTGQYYLSSIERINELKIITAPFTFIGHAQLKQDNEEVNPTNNCLAA